MESTPGLPSGPQPQLKEDIAAVSATTYTIDTFGTIIFIVVLVQVLLLIGLNLYEKSQIETANKSLEAKKQTLQTANYKTINDEVNQVLSGNTLLASALSNKVEWGKFYAELNAVTPKNVQLTTLSVTDTGQFKADGKTASLDSLAKALIVWQKGSGTTPSPFSTITLASDGFTTNTSGARQVTFSVSGQVNLGLLRSTTP